MEEFRRGFREAVRRRLVSDVPLGAFLSGGIDSSSVVAMMADALPAGAVKTFSIGFDEPSFDESAARAARRRALRHRSPRGGLHAERRCSTCSRPWPTFLDEPFADASILPTYLLSRFTRESVTVALGGDGGDELLAGYPTFPADRVRPPLPRCRAVLHERVVDPARRPAARLDERTSASTSSSSASCAAPARPRTSGIAIWLGSFTPAEQEALLDASPADPLRGAAAGVRERADDETGSSG